MSETRSPHDSLTIAEIIYDYAVVRGDLTEQYARDQLVQIMERRIAEKDAEIERLADVAETNTAAYEYAVVERDEARAALAAAGEDHLATERENGTLRAALADVTRDRDDLRARVDQVVGLAKVQAIACRAQHRADHERNWLDVLALLDTMTAEEE